MEDNGSGQGQMELWQWTSCSGDYGNYQLLRNDTVQFWLSLRTGVINLQPVGQMQPTTPLHVAHSLYL